MELDCSKRTADQHGLTTRADGVRYSLLLSVCKICYFRIEGDVCELLIFQDTSSGDNFG